MLPSTRVGVECLDSWVMMTSAVDGSSDVVVGCVHLDLIRYVTSMRSLSGVDRSRAVDEANVRASTTRSSMPNRALEGTKGSRVAGQAGGMRVLDRSRRIRAAGRARSHDLNQANVVSTRRRALTRGLSGHSATRALSRASRV